MKIKQLELIGFRLFEELKIDFPDSNMIVLIGENGSGKSSVLDAIGIQIEHFVAYMIRENLDNKSYKPHLGIEEEDISINKKKSVVESFFSKDKEFKISLSKMKGKLGYSFNSKGENSFLNIGDKINKELNEILCNLPILLFYRTGRTVETTYSKKIAQGKNLRHNQFSAYVGATSTSVNKMSLFANWYINQENLENERKITLNSLEYEDKKLTIIRDAIKLFLNALQEDKYSNLRVIRSEGEQSFSFDQVSVKSTLNIDVNGNAIPISQLSSGEKMLLMLVCDIARRLVIANPNSENPLMGKGIVLIDEIELHLHPKWQRNITTALQKTFPNIQFIITTHSPQVLSKVPEESILILKNKTPHKPSSNPIGRDSNGILEEIMGVEERPKETEEALGKIFELLASNEIEEAEKLIAETKKSSFHSADDPIYTRLDAIVNRKKLLTK